MNKIFLGVMAVVGFILLIAFVLMPTPADAIQRCNDNTFSSTEPGTRGACSRHGGVDKTWEASAPPFSQPPLGWKDEWVTVDPVPSPITSPAPTPKPSLPGVVIPPSIEVPDAPVSDTISKLNNLNVGPEVGGYSRDAFKYYSGSTRTQVLRDEHNGGWYDIYTGRVFQFSKYVEIDHLVPMVEAWASGAKFWSADKLRDFGNNTRDADHLVAVEKRINREKSGYEPHEWMPYIDQCGYLTKWVGIKDRYDLSVDTKEKSYITNYWNYYCTEGK